MSDPIFLTMTGENHGLVSAGCSSKTSIGRYAHVNHQDQIFALSLLSGWGYEKQSERRCMSFHKFIDKSTPLLALGINENERYFLEFDFYRINQFGHFEKYYFIEIRGASMIALQMNFDTRSGHDTECVTLAYDYIRCRHQVAATEYYHFALPANYNSLFSVQNPIVAARNAAQRSMPKVNVSKPFGTVKTPAPAITPVFAKSCLRGTGCTDAGTHEEPAENFGQMAIFAPPMLGGGLLAAQDAIARMTQVWGSWSPSAALGVARGIPYVGVLASALYIPSAGEGSDHPPGQREFWHGDELRKKANTQMKATTGVRFFWRPDSQGNMQVYGVHTGEGTPYEGVRVALMKWVEENRRYEFTPAGSVDGPLITWTPEKQAGAAGPSDTGHDVKPIDQATILVTPIPTGEDEYTTPAFPVPHERDLNDYILVFPADAGMEPIYVYLSEGNGYDPAKSREENARKPNIAQELTDEQKVELGGSGSGTPGGWGPEDEEKARSNSDASTNTPSKDELSQAASSANRNGLTDAGRALQKHGGREGSVYTYSSQKASVLNQEAQAMVNDILNNPNTKIESRVVFENKQKITVIEATAPDGRALRFNADGTNLIGFREPPSK